MTATLVALVALAIAPSLFQQVNTPSFGRLVSGRVIDASSGKPALDAVVVLWERSKSRSAGQRLMVGTNGAFEFSNVPAGFYHVAAEVPGSRYSYRTETLDIEITDSNLTGLGLLITPFGPRLITVTGKLVVEGGGQVPASLTRVKAGPESSPVQPDGSVQFRFRSDEKYQMTLESPPDGYYIKSVSAGSWNSASDTLSFSATPPATMRFTLAIGARRIRGRVFDPSRAPAGKQVTVTFTGPSPSAPLRNVMLNPDGTFEIARLRPGDYELQGRQGAGSETQFARMQVNVGNQDRAGVELVLKPLTVQKGRVVIEGAGRIEELLRFRPAIQVQDILGTHRVPIARDGSFEFQSFEGEYSVDVQDLPFEYDPSIAVEGASIEVKLRIIQTDFPGLRFRSPLPR